MRYNWEDADIPPKRGIWCCQAAVLHVVVVHCHVVVVVVVVSHALNEYEIGDMSSWTQTQFYRLQSMFLFLFNCSIVVVDWHLQLNRHTMQPDCCNIEASVVVVAWALHCMSDWFCWLLLLLMIVTGWQFSVVHDLDPMSWTITVMNNNNNNNNYTVTTRIIENKSLNNLWPQLILCGCNKSSTNVEGVVVVTWQFSFAVHL